MLNILILGAGPTGLGAGHRLHETGHAAWTILERNAYAGGLAASFVDPAGFTWDVGGHVLFSHYPAFDRAVDEALQGNYLEHLRECWVRSHNTWVPYPFQNNIRHLPAAVLAECLEGLRARAAHPADTANFREWLAASFGAGIVRHFMEPYNEKVWGVPLSSMSKDWIAERVAPVDLGRIEQNIAAARDDVAWGPNNRFRFPRQGGTGAIFTGITRPFREHIRFGHEAAALDLDRRRLRCGNGAEIPYDALVSTMPVPQLIRIAAPVPAAVQRAAGQLVHNSGLIVGLGFAGARDDSRCWMYFPEANCPFYRVTNFHRYAAANVPGSDTARHFSLMCETTFSPHRPANPATIIDETIAGLIAAGMISAEESRRIVSRHLMEISHSYPVPTLGRDAALAVIHEFLEARGIYSRGRFGAWKYEAGNMDHSFMQGVEVVDRILLGHPERTVMG